MRFLDFLVVFRLDFAQISFNLVEKVFATQQFALLAASIVFYDILARACAESKFWPTSIEFFFHCSFFSFSFLFAAVIGLLLGLMQLKKLPRKCHWDGQIWPWTFSLNFLSILVHISGSIRPITLTWASLEGSFPSAEVDHRWCQFGQKWWCQKWKKGPGSSQPVMADLGVNGLIFNLKFYALMSYDHLLMGQSWASCVRSY